MQSKRLRVVLGSEGAAARDVLSGQEESQSCIPTPTAAVKAEIIPPHFLTRLARLLNIAGVAGLLVGLTMMVTGILFIPGVFIALLGLTCVLLGFGVRFVDRLTGWGEKGHETQGLPVNERAGLP